MTPSPKRLPKNFFDDAAPFKIDGVYCKLIQLTRGQFAIVTDARYPELAKHRWHAHLDPESGCFYARRLKGGRIVLMSREIAAELLYVGALCDHENGRTLDNRDDNLRPATASQNGFNSRISSANKTGARGVSWSKEKRMYRVVLTLNSKQIFLGYRRSVPSAAELYAEAADRICGEFRRKE